MKKSNTYYFYILIVLATLVHFQGCFIDFFLDDPGLFGAVSKNMLLSGDFLQLKLYGEDWLDKPHLSLWCTALSMGVLGVNSFAYKLPAFICILLAAYYTYLFTKKRYDQSTAELASLILMTAQYSFMTATEGRVENYVTLAIIASIYHIDQALFKDKRNTLQLLFTAFWIGFGMMAKGTFVPIFIALAIFAQLVGTQKWKFIPYLLLLIPLSFFFILPELYALYIQFDSQPEKAISGIRWFLWDTQFGHFANSFEQRSAHKGYFFFLHTLIWAFLPWSILLYTSCLSFVKKRWRTKLVEFYSLGGGLLMFIVFSISKFQLPHYLSIIFPLHAILVANFIQKLDQTSLKRVFTIIQYVVSILLFIGVVGLQLILDINQLWIIGVLGGLFIFLCRKIIQIEASSLYRAVVVSAAIMIFVNAFLHWSFYPVITNYKGDNQAAFYINSNFPQQEIAVLGHVGHRFEFYTQKPILGKYSINELRNVVQDSMIILCTDNHLLNELNNAEIGYQVIEEFQHYPSEAISLNLLNPQKRKNLMIPYVLIQLKNQGRELPVSKLPKK